MADSTLMSAATVSLLVDGVPLPEAAAGSVLTVEVVERDRRPAQARVAVRPADASDVLVRTGVELTVRAGRGPELFTGTITTVERTWQRDGLATVLVVAHDVLHQLRGERGSAAYGDVTVSDVVQEVLSGRGIAHELHVQDSDRRREHVARHAESELSLLHRLAVRAGALLTVRGREVHWAVPPELGPPLVLDRDEDVHELRVVQHDEPPSDAVGSWDPATATGRSTGDGPSVGGWWLDPDEAGDLADALATETAARTETVEGTVAGNHGLRPGTRVRVRGVAGADPAGTVRSTVHRFDSRTGYVTTFRTAPPDPAPPPPDAALSLGTVVDVQDPEGRGRVRVTLDAFGAVPSSWLPVAAAGAGADRGTVVLPGLEDRVLVAGPRGDLGRGVVLGGLWGDQDPPFDHVVDGDTARYGLQLPNGMRLVLDVDAATVRLDDGAGSSLELGPDRVALRSAVDVDLEAPGRTLRLRADRIAMERA